MSKKLALTPLTAALQRMTDEQREVLQEEYGISCKGVQEDEHGASLLFEPKPAYVELAPWHERPVGQCARCKNYFSNPDNMTPWCRKKRAECNNHVENCWRFKLNR
ncbi:MAG: hypothetical protein IJV24_07355 [Prevotella sp.]|nr:hypothetical protein [Prevotella sp.]